MKPPRIKAPGKPPRRYLPRSLALALGAFILAVSGALALVVATGMAGNAHGEEDVGWEDDQGKDGKAVDTNRAFVSHFFDDYLPRGGTPSQGWEDASIEYFWQELNNQLTSQKRQTLNAQAKESFASTCRGALTNASARAGGGVQSRVVVAALWASAKSPGKLSAANIAGSKRGLNEFTQAWGTHAGKLEGWQGKAIYETLHQGMLTSAGKPAIRVLCGAANIREPADPNYQLGAATQAQSTVTVAGQHEPVADTITTWTDPGNAPSENLDATTILVWDGPEGTSLRRSKPVSIANQGSFTSPTFTPADFGWHSWPAGDYWFDLTVARQGKMADAIDLPDRDVPESWTVSTKDPVKNVYSPGVQTPVADLAPAQRYDAHIQAHSNGYSAMTISDIVDDEAVYFGAREADDVSQVQVLGPEGAVVPAQVSVERGEGISRLNAHISDITNQGTYTLVVPTYLAAKGEKTQIGDHGDACYQGGLCLYSEDKVVYRKDPSPDKVWVLDEAGALTTADPDWTNKVGADEKVFLAADAVSAVANGHIAANLDQALYAYHIVDDWRDGLPYLTFPNENAKVFFAGRDVTSMFEISTAEGITTATARAEFLALTAGLAEDTPVKLVLSGFFRDDYDTSGQTVEIINRGSETWNNRSEETNTPPVFTWTPDPTKDVLGSKEQAGDHTFESINGMSVLPGQKLEYSIGVDVRVPDNTARGIRSLAVRDHYDPHFILDVSSVEFIDMRSGRAIPHKYFTVDVDKENSTFIASMSEAWLKDNTQAEGANWEWLTDGMLYLRFTGTVSATTPEGTSVVNEAFQVINGAETATETPEVEIPPITPDKDVLAIDKTQIASNDRDINEGTLLGGDRLLYRLALDGGPSAESLAYYVHKLGMVDDFDEEHLDINPDEIQVIRHNDGVDVTDRFNVAIIDGVAYVFAKHVDHTGIDGVVIPGTQPEDLAAYAGAAINPLTDPIIDQSLLGEDYWILIPATVKMVDEDVTVENQARQVIENTTKTTRIVSNPLGEINPEKDVVIDVDSESVNGSEIALNAIFNYRLATSILPAGRVYPTRDWAITDTFDTAHDRYTGTWLAIATRDIYNDDELLYKAGETIATSEEDPHGYFTVETDAGTSVENNSGVHGDASGAGKDSDGTHGEPEAEGDAGTSVENGSGMHAGQASKTTVVPTRELTVKATDALLELLNSRLDSEAGWAFFAQMERVAPSEKVVNVFTETHNGTPRESNEVYTSTPEHPGISIVKYDTASGIKDGDRNEESSALTLGAEAASVEISYLVTNTGDVPLKDVAITDAVTRGSAHVSAAQCPQGFDGTLEVGESITCTARITGLQPGQAHADTATTTGKSMYTDTEVTANDDWNARNAVPALAATGATVVILLAAAFLFSVVGLGLARAGRSREIEEKEANRH